MCASPYGLRMMCVSISLSLSDDTNKTRQVRLLRKIVRSELRGLDDVCYRHSTQAQRLAKLSWKRVAEYIAESGGSYHFGNSTCKKKWAEIEARH